MFFGRNEELVDLMKLWELPSCKVVVVKGRRRIGKSFFIEHFAKDYAVKSSPIKEPVKFIRFSGLSITDLDTNLDKQLKHFADELKDQNIINEVASFKSWTEAFRPLANTISKNERTVLLIDEVSWVADGKDNNFVDKFKNFLDLNFSNYNNLMVFICGSYCSWIEKYIEESPAFVGRIDKKIRMKDLELNEASKFWNTNPNISNKEKLKFMLISGGVPKYLSVMNPKDSAEDNILRLCFTEGAFLFKEFPVLFKDAFLSKRKHHNKILKLLMKKPKTLTELTEEFKSIGDPVDKSNLDDYLKELEQADFVSKIQMYQIGGDESKFVFYRLSDNYSRFYLRYIAPKKSKIESGSFKPSQGIESWAEYETVMGFQFENLVLNSQELILKRLGVKGLKSFAPYSQFKTKQMNACQIDLLIEDNYNTLYVCDVKFQKEVKTKVISDVKKKIKNLKTPKNYSVRPVLIYSGELPKSIVDSGYFDKIINFEDYLK